MTREWLWYDPESDILALVSNAFSFPWEVRGGGIIIPAYLFVSDGWELKGRMGNELGKIR